MNELLLLITSPQGQAIIKTAAAAVYPDIIEGVKKGEAWLSAEVSDHPWLEKAVEVANTLLNAFTPGIAADVDLVAQFVKGEINTLSAADPSVSGTTAAPLSVVTQAVASALPS